MDEEKYVVNCNKMMSREKMMGDYERTIDVIRSCKTPEQLNVGIKMYNQLTKLHRLPAQYIDKLDNIVER